MVPLVNSLDGTLGALSIGAIVSSFLFGMLTIQALVYHFKFQGRDAVILQVLVGLIWFLELGQLGSVFHAIYVLTILRRNDPSVLLSPPPRTVGVSFLLSSCVGPLVEAFYVGRLYKFSNAHIPAIIGWVLTTAKLAGWIFLSSRALVMTSFTDLIDRYDLALKILLAVSGGLDLGIAAANYYYLSQGKKKTRKQRLTRLLDSIMMWSLQTGIITSVSFLATLFCVLFLEKYLIWLASSMVLTKVMSNCLFGSLNARPALNSYAHTRRSILLLSSPHESPISPTLPRVASMGPGLSSLDPFAASNHREQDSTVVDLYSSRRSNLARGPSLRSTRASIRTEGCWTL
ncbi:hypothetical protein HGRIS_005017 [Hohenbuehelia grisea]|uniref:DUF6534 domain-containing protein n=1 Tax=Hohenbuehelia grisea TaxID=104357 RepID=A0ABR3JDQ1_9AGAR